MKLLSLITIMGVVGAVPLLQAKSELPAQITKAIELLELEGKVSDVELEKEGKDVFYELHLKIGNETHEVKLNAQGKEIEREKEISVKLLPEAVKEAISKAYPDAEIEEAEEVKVNGVVSYEVEIESGKEEIELMISSAGVILSTEVEEDESDDDDDDDDES